jgi:RND family efflux transporter MFP subunit
MGKVTQINPSADPASRQFSVRVTLDNPDFAIKPGTFAHVKIETGIVRGALVVPREAVQHDRAGSYVMVIDDQSVARKRPVTLGTSAVAVIAITGGLRPGEKVVTLTAYPLKDGQAVSTGDEKQGNQDRGHRR